MVQEESILNQVDESVAIHARCKWKSVFGIVISNPASTEALGGLAVAFDTISICLLRRSMDAEENMPASSR